MESNIDRKERTVYVTGMHKSVTEDMIYDLFEKVGLVEKVVMHENDEGEPHHALVVFKHAESVMYSISVYNGYRLFDQSLNMRPLRESSHAAVFQRAGPSRTMSMRLAQLSLGPPTPPTSPADYKSKSSPRRIVKKSLLASEMKEEEEQKGLGIGGRRDSGAGSSSSFGMKPIRGDPLSSSPPPIERDFYASFPPQATYTHRYSPQPPSYPTPESGYLDRSFGSLGSVGSPSWTPRYGYDAQPFGQMWGGASGYGPVLSSMDTSFGRSPSGAGGSHPHLGMSHHHNNYHQRYRSQTSTPGPLQSYSGRSTNGYPSMPQTPQTPSWNDSLHDEPKR